MKEVMEIKVLGPGCPKCEKTLRIVKDAVEEIEITATIEKITDPLEMIRYGVMGTPAVLVDGQVKCSEFVPKKEEVKKWIQAEKVPA